jgi:hypothetical protein
MILGYSLSLGLPILGLYILMIINLTLFTLSLRAAIFGLYYLYLHYAMLMSRLIMKYTLVLNLALYASLYSFR